MPKVEKTLKRKRPRSRMASRRSGPTKQSAQPSCVAPECGRPSYVRGLCQTHHRQKTTTGRLRPIRPYRKRVAGTVKLAGLRLSPHCARTVRARADEAGVSLGATIAEILEGWHARMRKERASDGGG
ncbi:MAG TPA: hypothetical protein VK447_05785 [Myxococcaceae bacterium]|nr:hypothetical protein [Myxococcaceae bacterium]